MGADRKLWPEIRGKHCAGNQQGHPVLCHADAEPLLYLRAHSRRAHHRSQQGGRPAGNMRTDGKGAALASGSGAASRRVRNRMVPEGLKKALTDDGGRYACLLEFFLQVFFKLPNALEAFIQFSKECIFVSEIVKTDCLRSEWRSPLPPLLIIL